MSAGSGLSATTASFVTSLVTNLAIAGGELLAWSLVRQVFLPIYEPRSYMPAKPYQSPPLSKNLAKVFWQIYEADPKAILEKNGVDAYVYIRFLRMCLKIFIPIWIVSWAVLLPLDAVGTHVGTNAKLDRLTFGNVDTNHQSRLWGHLVCAWVFTAWVLALVRREMRRWVTIRQRHLVSTRHSSLASAQTVLLTGIPKTYMDEERIAQLFGHLPGGVKRVWLVRDLKEMPQLYSDRVTATNKLETAEINLIKAAGKIKRQRSEAMEKAEKKHKAVPKKYTDEINPDIVLDGKPSPTTQTLKELGGPKTEQEVLLADRLVPRSMRPTHKLPKKRWIIPIPFTGERVDTIDWARKEIVRTTNGLNEARQRLQEDIDKPGIEDEIYPPAAAAFIQFEYQISAHIASEILLHDQPYKMHKAYTEVSPDIIIWQNLNINAYEANVRQAISYAITGGIIFSYTFPSAFIGALSNVTQLCQKYHQLEALCTLGAVPTGLLQGVAPPILSALLNLLLPIFFRQLCRLEGMPLRTEIELSLMRRMIIFMTINTFIITTLSSGLITALSAIASDPGSIPTTLASQLPKASTYFLTYTMTQAAGAVGNLLQPITLVIYWIKLIILGGSPRSVYKLRYRMNNTKWGTQFPQTTIICVIVLAYMVISPIINGLAVGCFGIIYFVAKYNYTWTSDTTPSSETGGLFFPKAVTHLFIGMYIGDICLCALFFLARNASDNVSAIPQGALMIVLIVCTAAYQYVLIVSYGPLKHSLPLSLAYLSYGMPKETGHGGSIAGTEDEENDPRRNSAMEDPLLPMAPAIQVDEDGERPGPRPVSGMSGSGQLSANDLRRRISNHSRLSQGLPEPGPRDDGDADSLREKRKSSQLALPEPGVRGSEYEDIEMGNREREEARAKRISMSPSRKPENDNGVVATDFAPGITDDAMDQQDTQVGEGNPDVIEFDRWTFAHPAVKEPQRFIWLPHDDLELGDAEASDNRSVGIRSTTRGALLSPAGKVDITEPPPDNYTAVVQ